MKPPTRGLGELLKPNLFTQYHAKVAQSGGRVLLAVLQLRRRLFHIRMRLFGKHFAPCVLIHSLKHTRTYIQLQPAACVYTFYLLIFQIFQPSLLLFIYTLTPTQTLCPAERPWRNC